MVSRRREAQKRVSPAEGESGSDGGGGLHSYHYTARAPYKNCPICLNGKS